MKIDHIEVINLLYPITDNTRFSYSGGRLTGRLTTLVRVVTDDGAVGIGAAYSHPMLVRTIIEHHLAPMVVGEDPCAVESLWRKMYCLTRWYGRKGAAMSALGALDTAFWDLRGKAQGKPVYALLGGARDAVPAYASALLWSDDLEALGAEAAGYVDQGYRRVKMRLGKNEAYDTAAVRTVREAVGPSIGVIVDASMRYTLDVAERMAGLLEELDVFWYEEPFEPEDIDNYVALRQRITVPIAAGENEFGVQGFRELLRAGAVDVVQPDACRAGGITACYRVGTMAANHGASVGTHTWSDAVALTANAHVIAALANGLSVEVDRTGNPFIDELPAVPLDIRDGLLHLLNAPGLGIELNPDTLDRYALPPDQPVPDGAYSDMSFGKVYDVNVPPYE